MPRHRPYTLTLPMTLATLIGLGCSGGDLTLPGEPSGPTPGPAPVAVPSTLTAVAGDDQLASVGQTLDQPLTVQVLDAAAQPLGGVRVQFTFEGDGAGGSLEPATSTTDASGHAQATVRLGDVPGEQTVVAALADVPALSARFTVTATKSGRGHGG
jgi:ABC-type phosphate transport system substrate-binding protein